MNNALIIALAVGVILFLLIRNKDATNNKDNVLFGVIAAIVGYAVYLKTKNNATEVLLDNEKSKEVINQIDKSITEDKANLSIEESKREAINKDLEKDKKNETSDEDFFNDPNRLK